MENWCLLRFFKFTLLFQYYKNINKLEQNHFLTTLVIKKRVFHTALSNAKSLENVSIGERDTG